MGRTPVGLFTARQLNGIFLPLGLFPEVGLGSQRLLQVVRRGTSSTLPIINSSGGAWAEDNAAT
jgi:hypothetical protein